MAAEYMDSWSPKAKAAANQAVLSYLGAFAIITIHGISDEVLVTVNTRNDPLATIDAATGAIDFRFSNTPVLVAGSGTASYATLRTSSGVAVRSMPCTVKSSISEEPFQILSLQDYTGGVVTLKSLAFLAGDTYIISHMRIW